MTVAELIAELQTLPQEATVYFNDGEWGPSKVGSAVFRQDATLEWHEEQYLTKTFALKDGEQIEVELPMFKSVSSPIPGVVIE